MSADRYPVEALHPESDDGTMPQNVEALAETVIGHRIVKAEQLGAKDRWDPLILTLDTGQRVVVTNTSDCCAYTSLDAFLLHPERVVHVITGVGTTEGYTEWHIYADAGDVLNLTVNWSCGNPFYYGYGFSIYVEPAGPPS